MTEPLQSFYQKYSFDENCISKFVTGEKYTSVMLNNGNIGVCANLGKAIDINFNGYFKLDLTNISHRILYNAYMNALVNNECEFSVSADIFDTIDFSRYNNIVMIGYFKPVVEKFKQASLELKIFDLTHQNAEITPTIYKQESIHNADAVLLSATTIVNNTFTNLSKQTSDQCDIFLLGPSSILHTDILKYKNIKSIFGTTFRKNDIRVLNSIEQGNGTRHFQKYGRKVRL
ncbi:MAG: DUF364 domain-containing protein [Bacteroidales bacterium]